MIENENNKEFIYENLKKFNKSNRFYLVLITITFCILILSMAFILYYTYNRYNNSLTTMNQKYTKTFDEFNISLQTTEIDLLSKLDSLKKLIESQKINLQVVDERNLQSFDELGSELNKLWRVSYARNTQDITDLKNELKNITKDIVSLNGELVKMNGSIKVNMSSLKGELLNRNIDLQSRVNENSSLIADINNKLETITSKMESFTNSINTFKGELESIKDTIPKRDSTKIKEVSTSSNSDH